MKIEKRQAEIKLAAATAKPVPARDRRTPTLSQALKENAGLREALPDWPAAKVDRSLDAVLAENVAMGDALDARELKAGPRLGVAATVPTPVAAVPSPEASLPAGRNRFAARLDTKISNGGLGMSSGAGRFRVPRGEVAKVAAEAKPASSNDAKPGAARLQAKIEARLAAKGIR